MTDNFAQSRVRRLVDLDAGQAPEAALRRLVLAADAERRAIERELHEGVHQHLVALAVSLQLAGQAVDSDPAAVKSHLEEMRRNVQQALDDTALLAQRIYPATVETAGLGALLRSAGVNAEVPASVDVAGGADYPAEVAMTVYLCWLAVLGRGSRERRLRIDVREGEKTLAFEIKGQASDSDADLDPLQDRVEALGGRLTIEPDSGGGIRLSGSLPLRR